MSKKLYPFRVRSRLRVLLCIFVMLSYLLPNHGQSGPQFDLSSSVSAAPFAQANCPATPADPPDEAPNAFTSVITRPDFCVYFDTDATDVQAQTAANHIQTYWNRYVSDFGFRVPAATGRLNVYLFEQIDPAGNPMCNGYTSPGLNYFVTSTVCFDTAESIQKVLGHELFHRVQYAYDGFEVKWFKEGTARAIEDNAAPNIDNWPGAQTAVSSSFNQEIDGYLVSRNSNSDVTSVRNRYRSALFWKYFTEQFGTTTTEPELGVDALRVLWESAETSNDVAAVNDALSRLGAGQNFDAAFRRFVAANWTKDLSNLPDNSYNYIDEEQAFALGLSQLKYGPIVPEDGGTINVGTPAQIDIPFVSRYGARYASVQIGGNCPAVTVSFATTAGRPFYHIVTQNGSAFHSHVEGSGKNWSQSFLNDGISQVTAIVGGLANSAQNVDLTMNCVQPSLDIVIPNDDARAFVGTGNKLLAQVSVNDGSPNSPVVAGLTHRDFKAKVDGDNARVVSGGFVQEQYWLVIDTPDGKPNGVYDLEITLEEPGGSTVLASDINASSVVYDAERTDHLLMIDRSGSMLSDDKMVAAKAAANFYLDILPNQDGLGVVPFESDVLPAPFDLSSVNLTVKNNAQAYINALTTTGRTSIGDSLNEAVDQRNGSTTGNSRCSFVLLSDGLENEPLFWADVESRVVASGCPVTTIAFGPESDELLMQEIAQKTGGLHFFNDVFQSLPVKAASSPTAVQDVSTDQTNLDLANAFEYILSQEEGRQRLLSQQGLISPIEQEQSYEVLIDDATSEVLVALDWTNIDTTLELFLEMPDGSVMGPNSPPYTFEDSESGHLGWRIDNPVPGQWNLLVTHSGGAQETIPYQVIVSSRSNVTLDVLLPDRLDTSYETGNRIPIYAFLSGNEPITDAELDAVVTSAEGTETVVQLLDDGQHNDGRAGDGLYAGLFTRANQTLATSRSLQRGGTPQEANDAGYRVVVRSSHVTSQREVLGAFSVAEGQDTDNDSLPDAFEAEYGVDNPNLDLDLDGLDNLSEFLSGTDPENPDTDGDGENDGAEVLIHQQDPLNPDDGQIEAPEYFRAIAASSAITLTYDVKDEYTSILLYRSTSLDGPWALQVTELPLTGVYSDPAENDQTYYYRILAIDADEHQSAVLTSEPVTPMADPIPPQARVVIDNGTATTFDLDVVLTFEAYEEEEVTAFDDIVEMLISNDPFLAEASWQPFAQSVAWRLADTPIDEEARVYARFRDGAGNESLTELGSILVVAEPTLTPTATATSLPTETPTPTNTPIPTNTPAPAATSTPLPTSIPVLTATVLPPETLIPTNTPLPTATPGGATGNHDIFIPFVRNR